MNNVIPGLTFDEASHTYRMYGELVPSVTQILRPLSDFSGVPADTLAAASQFGTAVHKVCELHDLGTLDMGTVATALLPYLEAWKKFCADYNVEFEGIEELVYNPTMRYCGTLDRRALLTGERYIIDIKSSAELYPSVGPQLAAYRAALPDNLGYRCMRMAVQLRPDASYKMQTYTNQNDMAVFASLITLRNWTMQHNIVPNFAQAK